MSYELQKPLRILYDACRQAGRDNDGKECLGCSVRDICDNQLQRIGRTRETAPRYRPGQA